VDLVALAAVQVGFGLKTQAKSDDDLAADGAGGKEACIRWELRVAFWPRSPRPIYA